MRRTPFARIASSTLKVAIVFCSRSRLRMLRAEPDVGVGREVEDEVAARHRRGQRLAVQRVALRRSGTGPTAVPARGTRPSPVRQVVVAHDVMASGQQPVDEIAADEAGSAGDAHSLHAPSSGLVDRQHPSDADVPLEEPQVLNPGGGRTDGHGRGEDGTGTRRGAALRCIQRTDSTSRTLRMLPATRSSRLSPSSRQRTGTWSRR